jgi:hypothetical protein
MLRRRDWSSGTSHHETSTEPENMPVRSLTNLKAAMTISKFPKKKLFFSNLRKIKKNASGKNSGVF